jgi:hypothetical protein
MGLIFEWDKRKAAANLRKHQVSFEEAATVFGDPLSLTIEDPDTLLQEERAITVGHSYSGRTVVVVHVDRGDRIRIVSARSATRREKKVYEESH